MEFILCNMEIAKELGCVFKQQTRFNTSLTTFLIIIIEKKGGGPVGEGFTEWNRFDGKEKECHESVSRAREGESNRQTERERERQGSQKSIELLFV